MVLVYDDCSAKKQPIRDNDIAKCVLNALKMEESKVINEYNLGENILIGRSTRFVNVRNSRNYLQHIKIQTKLSIC